MVQKYVFGVAKKLKQIKVQCRISERCAPRLRALQKKPCLFCAVQYIAFHAGGRARKVQAGKPPRVPQAGGTEKETTMIKNIEDVQKMSKDNMDATMKSFGMLSKATQAIATEVADFSKKSFEDGTKVMEKLLGAKSIDKAIEIQTDYAKTAYEGFVAQATKIGELYADLAKETYKPFEAYVAKATPSK
jgi:hypothetical protein